MKVFDAHSDIFTDITVKNLEGNHDIIKKYHLEELEKGNVRTMILGIWIEPLYFNKDCSWRMLEIMGAVSDELEYLKEYGGVIYNYNDLKKLNEEDRLGIIMGVEGLDGIKDDINLIDLLYNFGVRHAMLTWNRENYFATGVRSYNQDRGLTELGVRVVKKMEEKGMILDVSHANEKTFWDIYDIAQKPFIASHSNAYTLCPNKRNLKDNQLKAIEEVGGVVGINAWPDFIDSDKPSVEKMADHIDYIANLIGIDHIGFGFDFCNYLNEETMISLGDDKSTCTPELEDASKINNIINSLTKRGYKKEHIEKIAYKNMERVVKQILDK